MCLLKETICIELNRLWHMKNTCQSVIFNMCVPCMLSVLQSTYKASFVEWIVTASGDEFPIVSGVKVHLSIHSWNRYNAGRTTMRMRTLYWSAFKKATMKHYENIYGFLIRVESMRFLKWLCKKKKKKWLNEFPSI